jgi:hypothetical protein
MFFETNKLPQEFPLYVKNFLSPEILVAYTFKLVAIKFMFIYKKIRVYSF